ncbi:MAG: hypothetical protein QHH06_05335 [Clostridiales bacterium]|jgi:hypothetical protein|nr:hypothetical protein [Eubacteriales bacterium]MDH7565890.1 hypothetical protein [Clostridiales bacterium]
MSKEPVDGMADLHEDAVLTEIQALKAQNAAALGIIAGLQEGMGHTGNGFGEKEKEDLGILMGGGPAREAACKYAGVERGRRSAQEAAEYSEKYEGVRQYE